ncbi:MAG: hypothetical protein NTV96_05345 [Actinobacteria bacterium]|nr:hypothetical protein [Actinomycetota bacterium]
MSMAALTLLIFAVVLAIFAAAFILLGMSNERAYWSQRDPSGDARKDATPLSAIAKNTFHYAAGEYRAPLRVVAIGVLMWWIAVACLILSIVVQAF